MVPAIRPGIMRAKEHIMQKVITCLGFDRQAEEAIQFYTSVVPNSRILGMFRCGDAGPFPKGTLLAGSFVLDGQEFMAINGGPQFTHTVGMSIVIRCETQAEIDRLWEKLSEGGQQVQCGWLTDRFGVSWQIVPRVLPELLGDPDPSKSAKVMQAMLQMKKLEVARLQAARDAA
jgi:predicted 3-demethylubiquinone-9 3-methyltransferase (glyoxalase superfamily)